MFDDVMVTMIVIAIFSFSCSLVAVIVMMS
jgi:hypothetical protein